ncbi:ADP-ribosylglycohydrolase family protein [Falsiroseomonas oryzae]|uniref:ADP-ribosylglycohydrolase family protein n=1 Tax=Falsiroseomonas oryzae TaxID=2766473 RepID=UPI0022EB0378|nr:ADP-ribosylglycohydrolase family protein [Roseomonas sp. MO-31]
MALSRRIGCLLGGAVGDALGAPVEFMSLASIRASFGPEGIRDYAPAYGRVGAITDDTQMTLFTAEGLLRAWVRQREKGICHVPSVVHHAYLRWLLTQGERLGSGRVAVATNGWLWSLEALHHPRAPGRTCLAALKAAKGFGQPAAARNASKGCGGVMRAAPVGLLPVGDLDAVFELGVDVAALTHGHPSGSLPAGVLAATVAGLIEGQALPAALDDATALLRRRAGAEETLRALDTARGLAGDGSRTPTAEEIERALGGGWVGEEALAIAVCCALAAGSDLAAGLRLAVNHSGDSDSTGAIAGNLLGAVLGDAAIPAAWLAALELRDEIAQVGADLDAAATGLFDPGEAWARYPGH